MSFCRGCGWVESLQLIKVKILAIHVQFILYTHNSRMQKIITI